MKLEKLQFTINAPSDVEMTSSPALVVGRQTSEYAIQASKTNLFELPRRPFDAVSLGDRTTCRGPE